MPRKPELETALEDRCVAKVEALGGMALKLAIPGVRGFPDRTVLLPQKMTVSFGGVPIPPGQWRDVPMRLPPSPVRTFFAEFKRLKTGRRSAQQIKWKRDLEALGFKVYFVDNDGEFDAILEEWR